MSEDKPKVIVIKKPQAPVRETPQVKEAPVKEEKKVVVVKKKIVTVKAKIKEEKNAGLTIVNDCLHLDIYEEDTPELKIIKQAINDKHIDPDSYKNKFPSSSDFNNDMRALKSASNHSISFFKAKRILNSFDIDGEFIIRDKKDAVNPIGKEYSIKLTEEE